MSKRTTFHRLEFPKPGFTDTVAASNGNQLRHRFVIAAMRSPMNGNAPKQDPPFSGLPSVELTKYP
jgi:hypothetical protein